MSCWGQSPKVHLSTISDKNELLGTVPKGSPGEKLMEEYARPMELMALKDLPPRARSLIMQSEYDMDTAEYLFKGERYSYAVFMCHLAVEKALKALFEYRLDRYSPRTHNLVYLLNNMGIRPDKKKARAIARLNEANIAARYPESLEILRIHYTRKVAEEMIQESGDIIKWIRNQFWK